MYDFPIDLELNATSERFNPVSYALFDLTILLKRFQQFFPDQTCTDGRNVKNKQKIALHSQFCYGHGFLWG